MTDNVYFEIYDYCRISASQTEQLNEKQQISQDKLDVRCLQVCAKLLY